MVEQADAHERDEDEELIEVEAPEVEEIDGEETEEGSEADEDVEGDPPADEIVVTFGDEAAPASDEGQNSGLVRKLRAEIRDRDARLAAFERGQQPQVIEVGEKPTLEACDYDEAKFETELDAWKERGRQAEQADAEAQKTRQATEARFAERIQEFGRQKAALKAPDFEAAEEEVVSGLSKVQQAIVVKAATNAATVIYALGKHPAKLATLAAIEDPIEFTAAVVRLEGTLKVTQRRKAPEPEGVVRGSASLSPGKDKHLERLEAEAERTSDRTKVVQYKRQLREKARK